MQPSSRSRMRWLMASAVYARLQSDPVFRAQRELARAELAKASAR
jgi:hypothetical protein